MKRFFLLLVLSVCAQLVWAQRTVTGTIVDEDNIPMIGANVLVKGTTVGASADMDGRYSVDVPAGSNVLVISYTGYTNKEIDITGQSVVDVVLSEGVDLGEVVVTALGIKRTERSLGFAQQSVKGDALTKTRETDISTALAGKVSGVQFTGQPTSTFKAADIRLRGTTGVLYVVDGVKLNARTDVNTDDIESMTVLKGLAATALYGPDGRNGAIVITTKKAKSGESSITLNSGLGFGNVYITPEYQNEYGGGYANDGKSSSERYVSAIGRFTDWEGDKIPTYFADESWGPRLEGQMVRHWDSWIEGDPEFGKKRAWVANPNNIKNFYQTGINNNNTLSFSKGGEDYSIRATAGYLNQTLVLENTLRNTINFGLNAEYNLNKRLKLSTNINYIDRRTKNDPDNSYGNLGSNFNQWWQRQLDMDRLRNYKRNGKIVSWNIKGPDDSKPLYWDSPYFEVYENIKNQTKNAVYGQVGLTYDIMKGLNATLAYKKSYNNYDYNDRFGWGGLGNPYYSEGKSFNNRDEVFGIANYDIALTGDLDLNASAGFELQKVNSGYANQSTTGGMTSPGFYSISASKDRPSASNGVANAAGRAWFGKAGIGFRDMLFVESSYRRDYSSTANPENNSVNTFSLSGSWVFSSLLPKNDIFTFGKLRAGYAEAPYFPGPYALAGTYSIQNPYGSLGLTSLPNRAVNPLLEGGRKTEFEVGAEIGLLKDRLTLDLNYFTRVNDKLPSTVTVPGSTGFTSFLSNDGKQTFDGIELGLSGTPIITDNFRWDLSFNLATLSRFVDYIADGVDVNVLSSWGPQFQIRKGKEWGAIYGNRFMRDEQGNKVVGSNGLYIRENNKYLGSILPDFTGGFTSSFNYMGFDLAFGFDYQVGGKFYGVSRRYGNFAGLGIETVGNNAIGNPVRNPVLGSDKPTPYTVKRENADPSSGGHLVSGVDEEGNAVEYLVNPFVLWRNNLRNIHEEYINDASYLKLRTIRFGYTLGNDLIKKTPFQGINIGLFANNVWLIHSDIKGVDPSEVEGRSGYNWIENGQLPSTRTIGVNLKLTL